jgi:Flp pilus assembly protein TadD
LGRLLADRGEAAGAIQQIETAVRLQPDGWRAHFELGMALGHKGDQKSATPGVSQIVMLEIKIDDAMRYIASAVWTAERFA